MIGGSIEMRDEMIFQEIQEGIKSIQAIADEYRVCRSTAWRIKKKLSDQKNMEASNEEIKTDS